MFKFSNLIFILILATSCASGVQSTFPGLKEARFATSVNFARDGYIAHFPILNDSGRKIIDIACYSLDDQHREAFAVKNNSDPVADLSCYVKDLGRRHESTMLGLDGEALQFSPGFFWFSDVEECHKGNYIRNDKLRGLRIQFIFSQIDKEAKRAELVVKVYPETAAVNDRLTDDSYWSSCS